MKQLILEQVLFILRMLFGGMAVMAGYDILRCIRWLIPHSSLVVTVEDLCYWAVMSAPVFYLFLYYHDGQIRWYGILAIVGGLLLYEQGLSVPVRHFLSCRLDPIRYKIRRGFRKLGRRIKKISKLRKQLKKVKKKYCTKEKQGV